MKPTFRRTLVSIPALLLLAQAATSGTGGRPRTHGALECGTSWERQRDAVAFGRYRESLELRRAAGRGGRVPLRAAETPAAAQADIGDVAVLEDDGTIVVDRNIFNLASRAARFEPAGPSSYTVVTSSAVFDGSGATAVPLDDDDSRLITLGFPFVFYGQTYNTVQLNSDGNLTFLAPDVATTERDLGRFVSGPPRIGPFFTDLDPNTGTVGVRNDPDGVLFAWTGVPEWGTSALNSFSVKLFSNGRIEFAWGSRVDTRDAVVGISPGSGTGAINAVVYSTGLPTAALSGTIAEVFSLDERISETALGKRFLRTHPDEFDQIVVFLAFPFTLGGAFAYQFNVANEVQGIGMSLEDDSADFGSNGRLKSFVMMGSLDGSGRYPADPNQKFFRPPDRTYNSLEILAHEVGHRWLATARLREGVSNTIALLKPLDRAHWSFFFNADGSVMEGNEIEDKGAGLGDLRFVTINATNKFSPLDRYLMGVLEKEGVPAMFRVESPTGTTRTANSLPALNVSFGGTRRDFTINEIVAGNGERRPSVFDYPKVHRQAFVLVSRKGQAATPEQVAKLQNLVDAWVPYWNQATAGRSHVVTRLQSGPGTTPSRIIFPYYNENAQRYTGFAFANWGSTPVDVLFQAYDNAGTPAAAPPGIVNPRMITLAAGAQTAMLGAQILNLPLSDPRSFWVEAVASSSQVTGFFLEGDVGQNLLDGAVAGNRTHTTLYFTRTQQASPFVAGRSYTNVVSVVNPKAATATVRLELMDASTGKLTEVTRVLGPRARLVAELKSLFPPPQAIPERGHVRVTSDVGVVGYQSIESASTTFGLPGQPAGTASTLYSAQFASGRVGTIRYFTDLNFVNTAPARRTLQVRLVDKEGVTLFGPLPAAIEAGRQLSVRGDVFFGLPDPAAAATLVEGSLIVAADGPGVIGDVSFGDPADERFLASLPLEGAPAADMVLSQVAEGAPGGGKPYFTGIAMYNPNAGSVTVTMDVYREGGALAGTTTFVLGGGKRVSQTLPQYVTSILEQNRGYIRIRSVGGPIVAFELFGDQALSFLAAVPPQPVAP